ncbi:C25 family cysteine peptidase [Desulfomarina sp.]
MKKITQHLFFQRDDLTVNETIAGTKFTLRGCRIEGLPGAPAFPVKKLKIALPPKMRPVKLRVKVVNDLPVTQGKTFVACIQPPVSPFMREKNRADQVLPDEKLYRSAMAAKGDIGVMGQVLHIGNFPVAVVEVFPLGYDSDGTVRMIEHCILTLSLEQDDDVYIKPQITYHQRYREHSIVHEMVVNPDLVRRTPLHLKKVKKTAEVLPEPVDIPGRITRIGAPPLPVPRRVDYLILTDNDKWDDQTMTTTGSAGDLVTEFKRLASHKKKRGYRIHVARIRDIVDGSYGEFTAGTRDLQEVIRNFLKHFVASRGVEWLLLGGDVSIIPPRLVCGCAWGRIEKGSLDKKNKSEWKGTYLAMHVDERDFGHVDDHLTNYRTGEAIPFDPGGTSDSTTPGWYHTTDSTFSVRSAVRTGWIRVNGPKAVVDEIMVWYTSTNMIPTDMYFSSLYSNLYNRPGLHDWDLLNNGLYGQHSHDNISLDGVDFSVDVGVGRAPVESVVEAKTFVDKVITYDNWGDSHRISQYNRFKKMLFVAEHWARYFHTLTPQPGNSMPPDNGHFSTDQAGGYALLHAGQFAKKNAAAKIICHFSDVSRKVLHFSLEADRNNPGWYYAQSAHSLSPSCIEIDLVFFKFRLPVPTEWVVVYGPDADISPLRYDVDKEGADSSVTQQEELRAWVRSNLGRINQVQRLYSDVTDTPGGTLSGAGLKTLTSENLEDGLNEGPHFVSLTGHGSSGGVAHLNAGLMNNLTNGDNTFIAVADSCLTNRFDVDDAIGEKLVTYPRGGAVAYVGNSRYSWIGVGDDFRLAFFKAMKYTRNLATLNDSRCYLAGDSNGRLYKIWTIFEQTLTGDPEMNVYRTDLDAYPKYIGNHKTKELHRSTCQWVKRMATWNMRYYDSIEEGINLGYDGCAFCLKAYDHG